MPEPKAQLVDPQGPIDVPGISATGIVTATGGFVGAVQGAATGLANTTTNLTVGVVTSTGFVGDVTGTASSVTKGTNLSLGIVTATSFAGDLTGNAAGLSTTTSGLKLGIVTATSFAGNFTGIGSGLTGTPHIQAGIMTATSFAGNFTGLASGLTGTPNIMVGVLTGTSYSGDGSALTGIAATNWITNNVTANSGTTAIDLSNGNTIKFTQTANTTVSFANTGTSNILTFIRANGSGTITWPSSVKWNNGAEPTLTSNPRSSEAQQFMFLTRDEGVTWYGWENFNIDPQNIELWSWGYNNYWGSLGTGPSNHQNRSSPIQLPGTNWNYTGTSSENSSFALKSNGELWTWGKNQRGNLGRIPTGETANRSPIKVPGTTWDGAYMGQECIFMSKTDGTLWTAGNNTHGQLGQNNRTQYSSPVQVPGTTWSTIRTFGGRNSFVGTKTNGTLWVMGRNEYGYLGMNNATYYSSPVQIPGTTWTDAIGAGYQTVGVIKTDGTLWMWGRNEYGELGQNSSSSPGNIPNPSPVQVGSDTNWSEIRGGNGNQIALKTDGTLWVWGTNGRGRLGLNGPTTTQYSSPTQIPGTDWNACMTTNDFCIATKTDGTLWAWGANEHGQCSQNDVPDKSSPVQIPGLWTSPLGGSFFHASAFRLID